MNLEYFAGIVVEEADIWCDLRDSPMLSPRPNICTKISIPGSLSSLETVPGTDRAFSNGLFQSVRDKKVPSISIKTIVILLSSSQLNSVHGNHEDRINGLTL